MHLNWVPTAAVPYVQDTSFEYGQTSWNMQRTQIQLPGYKHGWLSKPRLNQVFLTIQPIRRAIVICGEQQALWQIWEPSVWLPFPFCDRQGMKEYLRCSGPVRSLVNRVGVLAWDQMQLIGV